ncbi:ribosome maturation factor RimM [Candidatus Albibeggiatoa sp. nov. BB20]|uniref:ribosome maturation factor RimM n=1 Tax=Candidatus Albibeggiatoa sp. nov. BB20 TaxID=3162723 RepID=UPI003365A164
MSDQSRQVIVGCINGIYGVRGWVKVYSYTRPIENILAYSPWQLCQHRQWQTVNISEGKPHGKGIIVRLDACHTREQAALLLGSEIAISHEQLPPTEDDEYYWSDLVGLKVINQDGVLFGTVDYLIETGSNDVLVVKGERERLIPFVIPQFITQIDLQQQQILVDWDPEF